jgi:L-lactate dehydrogenase complex protein LldG
MSLSNALRSTFILRAEAAGARVHPTEPHSAALHSTLEGIVGTQSLLATAMPFMAPWVFETVQQLPNLSIDPDETQLAAGLTGITDVFAGVAETGSIALSNASTMSGPLSLFTSRHIALLDARSLVARPRDLFDRPEWQELIINMVFITGPSATADMGKLVRGVHGPGSLDIILIGEPS